MIRWLFVFFLFKKKTAYEMRISDWSSDVCSSDLRRWSPSCCKRRAPRNGCAAIHWASTSTACHGAVNSTQPKEAGHETVFALLCCCIDCRHAGGLRDRKSVVEGKSVSVRVALGGRRILKKNNKLK